jgi:hypothetical protein
VPRRDDEGKSRPFELKALDVDMLLEINPDGKVCCSSQMRKSYSFSSSLAATNRPDTRSHGSPGIEHCQRWGYPDFLLPDFTPFIGTLSTSQRVALTLNVLNSGHHTKVNHQTQVFYGYLARDEHKRDTS